MKPIVIVYHIGIAPFKFVFFRNVLILSEYGLVISYISISIDRRLKFSFSGK
jgi:hypothetical protein